MNLLSASQEMTLALLALASAGLGYFGLCGVVADRFTRSRRRSPVLNERDAPGVQCVRFPARDGRADIAGWYLAAEWRQGAIVFVHGKDSCRGDELKESTLALARQLTASGLAVLMIDLRGHGTSGAARLTYGAREQHDVLGAVDWLRAQGHQRIGVLGASMGAATSLLAAAGDASIAALVADSAFTDFGLMIERQYRKLSRMPRCLLPGALAVARLITGVRLDTVRPLEAAVSLRGRPVLVIHSEGDRFIPADDARALAAAASAELWITPGSRHLGSYANDPSAYAARVTEFFDRHLTACVPAASPWLARATHDAVMTQPAPNRQQQRAQVSSFKAPSHGGRGSAETQLELELLRDGGVIPSILKKTIREKAIA